MANYKISQIAKEDLIRIYRYGDKKFGVAQADKYYDSLFLCFEAISERPYSFESVDYIKERYRRCVCGADAIYINIKDNIVNIMAIIERQDLDQTL